MKKRLLSIVFLFIWMLSGFGCSDSDDPVSTRAPVVSMSGQTLAASIQNGETAAGVPDRLLVVDTRSSAEYIEGHIKDALSAPYDMIAFNNAPLYTNGYDEISATASEKISDSWLAHLLVNQLVNDFVSTYQDSKIVFYGDDAENAARVAKSVGYTDVQAMAGDYTQWSAEYPDLIAIHAPGVTGLDASAATFTFTGMINNINYANVSTRATHHGITYKGGALAASSFFWADLPPFLFQEILTYLGASPEGNMADGVYYGDMTEWQSKYPDGQRIKFEITWDDADRYYDLVELFEEKKSEFDDGSSVFSELGIEPRIGGTRDSNLNWNPGCIFCFYACVCGITSNARANEDTWFSDGGIYDVMNYPDDSRNYYAGRYYPKADMLPEAGETITVRATILAE